MLVYLGLIERGLEAQIKGLGLNRVVLTQNLRAADYAGGVPRAVDSPYAALSSEGELVPLRFSYARMKSNYGPLFGIGEYSPESLEFLASFFSGSEEHGALFFSNSLPEGAPVRVEMEGIAFSGFILPMPPLFTAANQDHLVLVPEGSAPLLFASGFMETVFFELDPDRGDVVEVVEQLQALHSLDYPMGSYPAAPVIQSAAKFAEDLRAFRAKQALMTAGLVAGIGGVIALVFGATAILEFRQSEFVCALMKSFGVGDSAILAQRLAEGILIANVSLLTALMLIPIGRILVHAEIVGLLDGFEMISSWPIFVCVNLGAFLAIIPLVFGLRRPIGEVLP